MHRVGPTCGPPSRPLVGIFSQSVGPSLAIWADPVQVSFMEAASRLCVAPSRVHGNAMGGGWESPGQGGHPLAPPGLLPPWVSIPGSDNRVQQPAPVGGLAPGGQGGQNDGEDGTQCSDLTPICIGMHRNAPLSHMKEGARVHHFYGSYALSTYGSYEPRRANPSTGRQVETVERWRRR